MTAMSLQLKIVFQLKLIAIYYVKITGTKYGVGISRVLIKC